MSSLIEILDAQRQPVQLVNPNGTVLEAIATMARFQIGCLVVAEDEQVVGLLSERDYLQKVVLRGRTSRTTLVHEIMTTPVMVAGPQDDSDECFRRMLAYRVKYLPIVDRERVIALLSRGDFMRHRLASEPRAHDRGTTGRYAIADASEEPTGGLRTG
jgi:CBS domain-containing protein